MGLVCQVDSAHVRLADGGSERIGRGEAVPKGADPAAIERLVAAGVLADDGGSSELGKIDDVLKDVGDDPGKAAAALAVERAGQNRPTLVSKLEAIVNAANNGGE